MQHSPITVTWEQNTAWAAMQRVSRENLLDASFLFAIVDADLPDGPHSVADPRVHATQQAIEDLFA